MIIRWINNLNLTPRLALAFLGMLVSIFLVLSIPANLIAANALKDSNTVNLTNIALEKQTSLQNWFDDARVTLQTIGQAPSLQDHIHQFYAQSPASLAGHADLVSELNIWTGERQPFSEISMVDWLSGRVIASTNPKLEGQPADPRLSVRPVQGSLLTSMEMDVDQKTPVMYAIARVEGYGDLAPVFLVGKLNLAQITAIANRRAGLHESDDSFLTTRQKQLVTIPRLGSGYMQTGDTRDTEALNACTQGQSSNLLADDYRGVPSLITYRWMPGVEMCLIVKISQEEAFAPAQRLGVALSLLGLSSLVILSLIVLLLVRRLARPTRDLLYGVEAFGRGEFWVRLPVRSEDEIGRLTAEFNHMADNLQQTLKQLGESEERYRRLADGTFEGLVFIENGLILDFNPQFAEMFAYPPTELAGKPVVELFAPESPLLLNEQTQAENSLPGVPFELIGRRRDDTDFHLEAHDRPAPYQGRWVHLISLRDVSQAKQMENELRQARDELEQRVEERTQELGRKARELIRSNSELEQFAYIASHDLQEPLRMISSYLQLLQRRYKDRLDSDADDYIHFAVDGAQRLKDLINDLLAYSRVGTHGRTFLAVDTGKVVERVQKMLQIMIAECDAQVSAGPLPVISGDAIQIEQLFQNLITNALKFRGSQPPRVEISASRQAGEWIFAVRDNGIGIESQYLERIFVIFQRLHSREQYSGTGIGLAVCKRIVERHGGRIWVESTYTQGSTFYFSLPAEENH